MQGNSTDHFESEVISMLAAHGVHLSLDSDAQGTAQWPSLESGSTQESAMRIAPGTTKEPDQEHVATQGTTPDTAQKPWCRVTVEHDGAEVDLILMRTDAGSVSEALARAGEVRAVLSTLRKDRQVMIIAQDMWRRRREMMQARILAHCGIFSRVFARNCEVRRIDRAGAGAFMNDFHSYGNAACRYCYGLFTVRETHSQVSFNGLYATTTPQESVPGIIPPGTLVAAAEFSNARRWLRDGVTIRSYEWVRYASLPGVRVSGGAGKVLNAFIQDVKPDDIMSYADLEWSYGDVYRQLGFRPDGGRAPVLFSIDRQSWLRHPIDTRRTAENKTPGEEHTAQDVRNMSQGSLNRSGGAKDKTLNGVLSGALNEAGGEELNGKPNRTAGGEAEDGSETAAFYCNFGSIKYRLRPLSRS